jgi:hypothetical protein
MLLAPLLVGAVTSGVTPSHLLLLVAWIVGYLAYNAAALWLKSGRWPRWVPPVRAYGTLAAVPRPRGAAHAGPGGADDPAGRPRRRRALAVAAGHPDGDRGRGGRGDDGPHGAARHLGLTAWGQGVPKSTRGTARAASSISKYSARAKPNIAAITLAGTCSTRVFRARTLEL